MADPTQGGGRAWVLNADGTRAVLDAEAEGMDEEDDLASPDTLLSRILRPTAPGPPAPFAGFEVRKQPHVHPFVRRRTGPTLDTA